MPDSSPPENDFGPRRRYLAGHDEPESGFCGRGPRGRRGPRMFESGALRYAVLRRIAEQPRHGYELIKAIEEQSGGAYSPSPGMIYPMLSMLEDLGFISASAEGARKLYAITPEGEAFLEENKAFADAVEGRMSARGARCAGAVRGSMHALKEAVFAKIRGQSLSDEQIKKAEAILNRAAKEIQAL